MRKIYKLNESHGNWTLDKLKEFSYEENKLNKGIIGYICWKEGDNEILTDANIFTIDVRYDWGGVIDNNKIIISNEEITYTIYDVDEFLRFLENPSLFHEQDKYNL